MKRSRIFRTFIIAVILSLLMAAIPATPVLAGSIELDPDKGPPGTEVEVSGSGFTAGTFLDLRFDGAHLEYVQLYGSDTTFTVTITVPQKDPDDYLVQIYDWSGESAFLEDTAVFTVTGIAEISVSPDDGPPGTEVDISGEGFDSEEDIEVYWDDVDQDNELDIEEGDEETDDDGEFYDTVVIIPESPAGDHTIIVKGRDSDTEAEAEFTVTPKLTVDPTSGSSGIKVKVSGSGFGGREYVTIYFNGVEVDLPDRLRVDRDGSFTATITVPEVAPGTYNIEAEDGDKNDAGAKFKISGEISINPVKGNVGTKITVTGTGFKANSPVIIKYDNIQTATATAGGGGAFSVSFSAPKSTVGKHPVTATDGTNTSSATFEIKTSASISQPTGNVGTEITVTGSGFTGQVTIKYDDKVAATTTADASGAFSASFAVPQSTKGEHNIIASDGTNTLTQTFTMESEAPAAPELLLPEADTKAKAMPFFDWEDAEDPSQPVTYILQVATDDEFTEKSIVLEKTELTDSEYTVTEEEKLEPAKEEAPYHWRVKAIDGASNEGDWSKSQSFYTGGFTFSMSGWILYLVIGLGAFVLFLFGLWVGRRTAYY